MIHDIQIQLPHINLAALSNVSIIDNSRPTLLFLHGYLDNANSFSELIPRLNDWQCLAIDMAGHGCSGHRSADAHYHLSDYAYDLHQIIEVLALQKVILIGHSLGAIVASIYAATQPKQVCGFIAIESCGPLSESEETTSEQLKVCFQSRTKALSAIKHPSSMASVIKARCAISDLSETQANIILSRNIEKDETGNLRWRTDKRLRTTSALRMTEKQAINILRGISCPRIVILGNQGFDKVKVGIKRRKVAFSDVSIFNFEGGHHVHMTAVESISACIEQHVTAFFSA